MTRFLKSRRRALALATAAVVGFLALSPASASDPRDSGPLGLIVTFHVAPGDRVMFRHEIGTSGLKQLQAYKEMGLLTSYRVLSSRYVDSGNWDVMTLLQFSSAADVIRWKAIEQDTPAGAPEKAVKLTRDIDTVPVDLVREGGDSHPARGPKPVTLVVPYEYLVAVNDYLKYLDGYTIPQIDGWIGEGVLTHYAIYLSRYPAGRPWNAMLVLDYAGDDGLARRDATVAKVRAKLKDVPEWKAWADDKKNIRAEKQALVADDIEANADFK
jgi:hypothetical protein